MEFVSLFLEKILRYVLRDNYQLICSRNMYSLYNTCELLLKHIARYAIKINQVLQDKAQFPPPIKKCPIYFGCLLSKHLKLSFREC